MYQTALICRINPDDFTEFEKMALIPQKPLRSSRLEYKGCSYDIENIEHYRLFMTLFVESFSATNLSLLDVCGYLINNLYNLGKNEDKTSFHTAFQDLHILKQNNPDAVYNLLSYYISKIDQNGPPNPNVVPWFQPLKLIRNRTTHRPITDVCDVHTSYRRSLHAEPRSQETEFILNRDLFPTNPQDVKLRDFVQEVFEGMQEFVEDLYDYLKQAVIVAGSLPLS
jgi:Cthe_2314-like HEPN